MTSFWAHIMMFAAGLIGSLLTADNTSVTADQTDITVDQTQE